MLRTCRLPLERRVPLDCAISDDNASDVGVEGLGFCFAAHLQMNVENRANNRVPLERAINDDNASDVGVGLLDWSFIILYDIGCALLRIHEHSCSERALNTNP